MWYNQPVQIQILRQQSTTKMEDIYACELFWKADSFQSIDLFMGDQQTKACSSYWIGKPQFITIPGCRTLYCFRLVAWDQFARLPAHRQIGFPIHQQEFLDTSRSDKKNKKSHDQEEFEFELICKSCTKINTYQPPKECRNAHLRLLMSVMSGCRTGKIQEITVNEEWPREERNIQKVTSH